MAERIARDTSFARDDDEGSEKVKYIRCKNVEVRL
jgi:hypothetical protein